MFLLWYKHFPFYIVQLGTTLTAGVADLVSPASTEGENLYAPLVTIVNDVTEVLSIDCWAFSIRRKCLLAMLCAIDVDCWKQLLKFVRMSSHFSCNS